jgi:hypothetical protein
MKWNHLKDTPPPRDTQLLLWLHVHSTGALFIGQKFGGNWGKWFIDGFSYSPSDDQLVNAFAAQWAIPETPAADFKLNPENQSDWEIELDRLGYSSGMSFHVRLSQCVNNLDEFAGLTPREALQQGWLDYAADDGG